jgi:hypothetical protein
MQPRPRSSRFVYERVASIACAGVLAACASTRGRPARRPAPVARCPTAFSTVLPAGATDVLALRVQRIFEHRAMAVTLAAFFDQASERALLLRAERYGYDARTLDRAAIAWTPRGSTLYVAHGPLDGARIARRLWDRLVRARARTADPARNERLEGELVSGPVSLLVRPACGVAAYVEGPEGRLVDRVMADVTPDREGLSDPDPAIWWRTTRRLERLEQTPVEGVALLRRVRAVEVHAEPAERGLDVALWLDGPLPEDAEQTLRRAIAALVETPMGSLSGAIQWAAPSRVTVTRDVAGGLRARTTIPWAGLQALAAAMAGRV